MEGCPLPRLPDPATVRARLRARQAAAESRQEAARLRAERWAAQLQQLPRPATSPDRLPPTLMALPGEPEDRDQVFRELQDQLSRALQELEVRTQQVQSLQAAFNPSEDELAATLREMQTLNEELQALWSMPPTGSSSWPGRRRLAREQC